MGSHYNPRIVTDGLVLHLDAANVRSYPGSGTTWTDLSGLGNNGTLTNGPTFNANNAGSIVFDGTNDYTTLGTPTRLNQIQVPLTICAWVNLNSSSGLRTIWGVYSRADSHEIYSLLRVNNGTLHYYASNVSGGYQSQASFTVNTGVWCFIAAVVSGSISSPTVTNYLNTQKQTFSYSAFSSTPIATVDFRIGGNQAQLNEGWNGNIAQVFWYNKALNDSEIRQNFNATRGRFGI